MAEDYAAERAKAIDIKRNSDSHGDFQRWALSLGSWALGEHLSGGSLKTLDFAIKHRKPHLHLSAASKNDAASELKKWLQQNNICMLNVAGPSPSKCPEKKLKKRLAKTPDDPKITSNSNS